MIPGDGVGDGLTRGLGLRLGGGLIRGVALALGLGLGVGLAAWEVLALAIIANIKVANTIVIVFVNLIGDPFLDWGGTDLLIFRVRVGLPG